MHLLLIGHGYLGQAITGRFRAAAWQVTAISLSGGDGAVAGDVSDPSAVRQLRETLPAPDFIVHCAATGHGGAEAYERVYVAGCRNLLEAFPGVPLLFVSSSSVYAQTDGGVVTETSPAEPDRDTGRLLRQAEQEVLTAGGIVARLAGIYGPGRSVILKRFLLGEAALEDDGRRFLNQIHRDDAACATLHLAERVAVHRGEVFNVCDSTPLVQLDCYRELCRMFQCPLPPSAPRDLNRKRGWTHKQVSNAKLRATGWEPRYPSFLDAVRELAPTL